MWIQETAESVNKHTMRYLYTRPELKTRQANTHEVTLNETPSTEKAMIRSVCNHGRARKTSKSRLCRPLYKSRQTAPTEVLEAPAVSAQAGGRERHEMQNQTSS